MTNDNFRLVGLIYRVTPNKFQERFNCYFLKYYSCQPVSPTLNTFQMASMLFTCGAFLLVLCLYGKSLADFTDGSKFDYVVVGGGSAGSTLAGRLSDENQATVLLIEAGLKPTDELKYQSPYLATSIWKSPTMWEYPSVDQNNKACLGYVDKKCHIMSGRLLGGGSSVNSLVYARGSKHEFDKWAEMGADGWNYESVLPYFKKAEGLMFSDEYIENEYHGVYGPQSVSRTAFQTNVTEAFIASGIETGFKKVDYHGKEMIGISKAQTTSRNGARCSTEKAYLRPAYGRKNLKVLTGAHATKILFNADKRATQVQFDYQNKKFVAKANKEIIISAGAYRTPIILMQSGIGPADHLKSLGIDVISDLPVGKNLQDHIGTMGLFFTVNKGVGTVASRYDVNMLKEEFKEGKGLYTSVGAEMVVFHKSEFGEDVEGYPDNEFVFLSRDSPFAIKELNDDIKAYLKPYLTKDIFSVIHYILHPNAKGEVRLNTTNPYDNPIIDYQYLADQQDLNSLVAGLKKILEIAKAGPLAKLGAKPIQEHLPGCEKHALNSDEYLICYARMTTIAYYHPVGTAKIGRVDDPTTVVDSKLRVKGVKGLRVADCSIIPMAITGHTNAPAIMIGEKAADLIRLNPLL